MDSQLYLVINAKHLLGQNISKRLAEKGNVVVYLAEDEQEGYALAAEEPRIRYRYCLPTNREMISSEIEWTQRCVSSINGMIVMVSASEVQGIHMPLEESPLASSMLSNFKEPEFSLIYVIVPDNDTDSDVLKSLHLALCSQAHRDNKPSVLRTNYILISTMTDDKHPESAVSSDTSTDVSNLIRYLTSPQAGSIHCQAFYF